MKVVGLTGGIGSGKSVVAKVFRSLGVPVFDSDLTGRRVLDEDESVINGVKELFGNEVYASGKADRKKIATIVFEDQEKLEALNALVHPAVKRATDQWLEQRSSEGHTFAIKEAAILFETGIYKSCDAMVTVIASEALRIERVVKRDGVSADQIKQRMAKQWSDERKKELSDHLIYNEGNASVIAQACEVNQNLRDAFK